MTQFDHKNVRITCLWDNERIHDDMRIPMYTTWTPEGKSLYLLHCNYHTNSFLTSTGDEPAQDAAPDTERRDIPHSIMTQIINSIKASDMSSAVKSLVSEKVKIPCPETRHFYSVYRDLLYLSFVALGRENIDQGESP